VAFSLQRVLTNVYMELRMEFSSTFQDMESYIRDLQNRICTGLEAFEPQARFHEDRWEREAGGGGHTRVLANGETFDKGGVNISTVFGEMSPELAQQLQTEPRPFAACGLSLVIHPRSPRVPTVHMNVRYFETEAGPSWFGGGIDLTPYFPHPLDFSEFHRTLHDACERAMPGSYPGFKAECDRYFTLRHRHEMRGIGGVFFDHLDGKEPPHWELVQAVGDAFLPAYEPIVARRRFEAWSEEDLAFQRVRRGRYVEFNLIYDRGTLFGLRSGGRIESIFMSLPPEVHFHYDWHPEPDSVHAQMQSFYQPYDWSNGWSQE
jgi:coproporphyrinogen III oxidase